jgi:hypothetical protein
MEVSMHGSYDKSDKSRSDNQIHQNWSIGLPALLALFVVGLIGLVIVKPAASNWISEAVEAEFTGIYVTPDLAPTQIARPAMEFHTVRVN